MTMERLVEMEWLDSDEGTQQEIAASLRSISRVNRRYGGVALHARLLGLALARTAHNNGPPSSNVRASSSVPPSILEVASGHADVLQAALLRLGCVADITLLDRSARHLPDPQRWPSTLSLPKMQQGDALALPFGDRSIDIVSCCLFLHHLEPAQVALYLKEAQRVARVAVVINDLERASLHYRLAKLNSLLDPSRISQHDGPVSVRRAYTYRELARMLAKTGHRFLLQRAFLFRLGAVVWSV